MHKIRVIVAWQHVESCEPGNGQWGCCQGNKYHLCTSIFYIRIYTHKYIIISGCCPSSGVFDGILKGNAGVWQRVVITATRVELKTKLGIHSCIIYASLTEWMWTYQYASTSISSCIHYLKYSSYTTTLQSAPGLHLQFWDSSLDSLINCLLTWFVYRQLDSIRFDSFLFWFVSIWLDFLTLLLFQLKFGNPLTGSYNCLSCLNLRCYMQIYVYELAANESELWLFLVVFIFLFSHVYSTLDRCFLHD